MKSKNHPIFKSIVSVLTLGLLAGQTLQAQLAEDEQRVLDLETYIVTGTRVTNRTVEDSIHPIDLVPASDLGLSVSADLTETLVENIPSLNVQRLPMADGEVFVRPARLRGLSPDHTLVMINGKRFHRTPLLPNSGAQGPDLAKIPSNAIGHVEVLRDGASAQYGSDAIAGAINILLNDKPGYYGFAQFSQFYEGDGVEEQFGFKAGWNISDKGFVGITAFKTDSELTSRSRQRADAIALQEQHPELDVKDPVQRWGRPEHQGTQLSLNSYYSLTEEIEAYAFGIYGEGEGYTDFNWRNPVYSMFGESETFPGWTLVDVYPVGFSPNFGQDDKDYQAYAGVRDVLGNLHWDVSVGRGRGEIDYKMSNSYNVSMGPNSPTSFAIGNLIQSETTLNFDLDYAWETGFSEQPVNIAFGAEHRNEEYEIVAGETASYEIGPGAVEGLPSGSNGFPGFSNLQAGSWDQSSKAVYGDFEWNPTTIWNVEVAGRWEDYDSFGSNTDYKVASRLELTDALAIRGAISTGFRAPTPAQIYSTKINQGLDSTTLEVYTSGRISVTNPVAKQFGAKDLEPETSENMSAGLVWSLQENTVLSLDYYQIKVKNRFGTSDSYSLTDEIKEQLLAAGVSGADSFSSIYFFTNDYDTKTSGIDLTLSHLIKFEDSQLKITLAYNHNETSAEAGSITSDPDQIRRFEEYLPQNTGNISFNYQRGAAEATARVRYFGSWLDYSGDSSGDDIFQQFGSLFLVDLSASYRFDNGIGIRVGAENLLDKYPEEATYQANRGLIYSRNAPYSTDGGRFYVRLDYRF